MNLVCGVCPNYKHYKRKEKPMTNFENITKDVDTLAQWLSKEIRCCNFIPCNECIANISEEECNENLTNFDLWKAWLKQPQRSDKNDLS